MKLSRSSVLLFALLLSFSACGPKGDSTEQVKQAPEIKTIFDNISVQQFRDMPADSNVVILDVRTDGEVAEGAIENSIQIDFYSDDFKERVAELDPTKSYVVYCRSGGRSSQASRIMSEELGFQNVKNLEGGYNAYSNQD